VGWGRCEGRLVGGDCGFSRGLVEVREGWERKGKQERSRTYWFAALTWRLRRRRRKPLRGGGERIGVKECL